MLDETTQEKPAQKSKKNVPIASDVAPQNTQTDTPGEITLPETTTPLLPRNCTERTSHKGITNHKKLR